jgi:GAF domain-containing protein
MINEDAEQRAAALGAVVLGKPARSWLGVPLIVGGDVIGAMVVQDVERERRFTEDDQRLLTTLAAQVGAAIRNVQILEKARQQARRERALHEMTSKIRSTVDMRTIMATAAVELGKALNLRRAQIRLGVEPLAQPPEDVQAQTAAPPAYARGRRKDGESSPGMG